MKNVVIYLLLVLFSHISFASVEGISGKFCTQVSNECFKVTYVENGQCMVQKILVDLSLQKAEEGIITDCFVPAFEGVSDDRNIFLWFEGVSYITEKL